ncbi:unnamed protein product [Euphydryas editha]|uniref:Uncharacterized protein n=1 Tax=Euphydryas editha TaxID=104508 RepID=A0AAU9UYP9_EUPED|nr:unnamed protein product [Euphydryas editha]
MLDEMVKILRYFQDTKLTTKYTVILSDAIPLINCLRRMLENTKDAEGQLISGENVSNSKLLAADLILAFNERLNYLENEESYYLAVLDLRYKHRIFHKQYTIIRAKRRLGELLNVNLQNISESMMPQPSTSFEPSLICGRL